MASFALSDSISAVRVCTISACEAIVLVCSAIRSLIAWISRWTASAGSAAGESAVGVLAPGVVVGSGAELACCCCCCCSCCGGQSSVLDGSWAIYIYLPARRLGAA